MPEQGLNISADYRAENLGSYDELLRDRGGFQRAFRQHLLAEPALAGHVLDIGAGGGLPPYLADLAVVPAQLDGVDPDPAVLTHPLLRQRWHAPFERADIPRAAYDLAYAHNVVEHVAAARPFFEKVREVLKSGGVFWALTPHGRHPFCLLSRGIEIMGGKSFAARRNPNVNDYPAYYRLNRPAQVLQAIRGLGFASASFHFFPSMQWDQYFPAPLRAVPHLYDRWLGTRRPLFMLVMAYRLEAMR